MLHFGQEAGSRLRIKYIISRKTSMGSPYGVRLESCQYAEHEGYINVIKIPIYCKIYPRYLKIFSPCINDTVARFIVPIRIELVVNSIILRLISNNDRNCLKMGHCRTRSFSWPIANLEVASTVIM